MTGGGQQLQQDGRVLSSKLFEAEIRGLDIEEVEPAQHNPEEHNPEEHILEENILGVDTPCEDKLGQLPVKLLPEKFSQETFPKPPFSFHLLFLCCLPVSLHVERWVGSIVLACKLALAGQPERAEEHTDRKIPYPVTVRCLLVCPFYLGSSADTAELPESASVETAVGVYTRVPVKKTSALGWTGMAVTLEAEVVVLA